MSGLSIRAVRGALRDWEPIDGFERLSLLSIPATFAVVFAVALWLHPDPRGLGTHQQLGLSPCTLQAVFHIPCPTCGMTTAFSHMAHGHFVAAFLCQPAGAVLFVVFAVASVACGIFTATGRRPKGLPDLLQRKVVWGVAVAVLAAAWIYKIIEMRA